MHREQRPFFRSVFNLPRKAWGERNSSAAIRKQPSATALDEKQFITFLRTKRQLEKPVDCEITLRFLVKRKAAVPAFDSTFPHRHPEALPTRCSL
ncbi:hypothetical protein TNCT_557441 [Trichonephila clavata]|uniref:Uncharacterized protein n=1 Tax=Trichonephila clavata TaxID=2740835 RepID=A0A8X6H9A8_TRICU|nr:hypothetical protein TNCT_557441 [Trichonephila clavata]